MHTKHSDIALRSDTIQSAREEKWLLLAASCFFRVTFCSVIWERSRKCQNIHDDSCWRPCCRLPFGVMSIILRICYKINLVVLKPSRNIYRRVLVIKTKKAYNEVKDFVMSRNNKYCTYVQWTRAANHFTVSATSTNRARNECFQQKKYKKAPHAVVHHSNTNQTGRLQYGYDVLQTNSCCVYDKTNHAAHCWRQHDTRACNTSFWHGKSWPAFLSIGFTLRVTSLWRMNKCHLFVFGCVHKTNSVVASPKILGGGKMFDFRRITLFCLENASQSTR